MAESLRSTRSNLGDLFVNDIENVKLVRACVDIDMLLTLNCIIMTLLQDVCMTLYERTYRGRARWCLM